MERAEKMVGSTYSYNNMIHSTIGTILNNKEKIMQHVKSILKE